MIGGKNMLKNNKKGFTLVELLAVIVILAIILAIAVPSISNMMGSAKKSAFEDNVKLIIKGIDYKVLEAQASGGTGPAVTDEAGNDKDNLDNYGANPADYESFSIEAVGSGVTTKISITGTANGKFGACTVTNATLSNITQTGTAPLDGLITGC
jgi:type IV pilus assembly protein PilA